MAQVNCVFSWNATAGASGYRVFHLTGGESLVVDQAGAGYETVLDLEEGDQSFAIEAYNAAGAGPRSTVTRRLVLAPGQVSGFDVVFEQ